MAVNKKVLKVWNEFWNPLFERETGHKLYYPLASRVREVKMPVETFNAFVEQVMKELYDYERLMDNAGTVYEHVTGGMISKPNTIASNVCSVADESYQDNFTRDGAEWLDFLLDDVSDLLVNDEAKAVWEKIRERAREHFNLPTAEPEPDPVVESKTDDKE